MKQLLQSRYWKRGFNRLMTIIATSLSEKTFRGSEQVRLLYVLKRAPNHSDTMIVCFPACSDKPKYNYVGTLRNFPCHKLFLKDDGSADKKGNYLIGGGYEDLTVRLIKQWKEKLGIRKLIFVGSSKGGYSALNFSLFFPESHVCIAAPQYRVGSYMNGLFDESLRAIVGEVTPEKIESLDLRMKDKLKSANCLPHCVYLHVSKNEHTWKDHCEEMVEDLQSVGIPVEFDFADYEKHADLIYYFPKYLKATVAKLIKQ